jgi:HK97 family phage prohead protease
MQKPLHKGFVQSFEVKDFDLKTGDFVQAFTRYHVKDSDSERGRPGMFTKTIQENFSRIRHVVNHDMDWPVGEPEKIWEEGDYAYLKSKIGTHADGMDFREMVDSGLIKEASYGFNKVRSNRLDDGTVELLEVKLWEISSLTSWGANEYTPIVAFQKGCDNHKAFEELTEKYLALESFCYKSKASDKAIKQMELERDQIKNFIKSVIDGTYAAEVTAPTPPDVKSDDYLPEEDILSLLQLNNHSLKQKVQNETQLYRMAVS